MRFGGLIAKRWPVVGGVLLVAALVAFLAKGRSSAPQIVTLPNGQQYRFAGTTYGTNHVHGPILARLVERLPTAIAMRVKKSLGSRLGQVSSRHSVLPSLFFWFDPLGTNFPAAGSSVGVSAILVDAKGDTGGTQSRANAPLQGLMFWAVPRRGAVLELRLFRNAAIPPAEVGRIRIPNPLYGRFPQWQPEPVPAVKMAGDLEVHLEHFLTLPGRNGEEARTIFDFALKSASRGPKETWVIHSGELSDATGNHLLLDLRETGEVKSRNLFTGTLWPDETAWRLRLELKRIVPRLLFEPAEYGFRPDEVITFTNVPVLAAGATNTLWRTNTIGGVQVVLCEYVQEPSRSGGSGVNTTGRPKFHVECAGVQEGISLDFVAAATRSGQVLDARPRGRFPLGEPFRPADCFLEVALLAPPPNAQAVDLTWVVQKTRSVDFLVNPPSP